MAKQRVRANGEGTIYWDERRNRYVGELVAGYRDDGRPIRKKVQAATKAEVRGKLAELRRQIDGGATKIDRRLTVKQQAERWLTEMLPTRDVKASTERSYRDIVNHYVIPTWGSTPLARLSPVDVERGLGRLAKQGYSRSTVRHAKHLLGFICDDAEREGLILRNPCRSARLPKTKDPRPRKAMTPDQAQQLLVYLDASPLETPVRLALITGMRLGELLALRWDDLSLKTAQPTLTVRKSKTPRGRRVIPLARWSVPMLRAHRVAQVEAALALGPAWSDNGLVFPSEVGTPWDHANFRHRFQKACRDAGIGQWTPHELRHTTASWLISEGVPLKEVADTLGHASITVTADVYGHLFGPSERVASAIEGLLEASTARSA